MLLTRRRIASSPRAQTFPHGQEIIFSFSNKNQRIVTVLLPPMQHPAVRLYRNHCYSISLCCLLSAFCFGRAESARLNCSVLLLLANANHMPNRQFWVTLHFVSIEESKRHWVEFLRAAMGPLAVVLAL